GAHHLQDGVRRHSDALGILTCLVTLDDPGPVAFAAAELTDDTYGVGLVFRLHQDGEAAATDITPDRHLPVCVQYLDMVAEHPRVRARAPLADGAQGILDIARRGGPPGLRARALVCDPGCLGLGVGEARAAFRAGAVALLRPAGALGQGLLQARGQLVGTVLLGADRVQPAAPGAEIDPGPGQQLG